MKPSFAAALPPGTYNFTVNVGGGGAVAFSVTSSLAAPLFWMRNTTSSASAWKAFDDAISAASAGTWSVTFTTSLAYGVIASVNRLGGTSFVLTADAAAQAWFGLPASGASVLNPPVQQVATTLQPYGTWYPNAYLVNLDDYRAIERQVSTSALTGTAQSVGIDQSDGVTRYWRCVEVATVAGGRITSAKIGDPAVLNTPANSTAWANAAGSASLVNQGARASLDGNHGWWAYTVSGQLEFVISQDYESDVTYASRHKIAYDGSAPVDMSGWRGLREPNVEKRSTGNMLTNVRFCAVFLGET